MRSVGKELLHREAGEVGRIAARRGCSTSVLPKNFFDASVSFFAGADAPDPLRAVAHLPRPSVSFGNARVEEDEGGFWR